MNVKSATIKIRGRETKFTFPDVGNAGQHLNAILSGTEYPLLRAQFAPTAVIDIGANIGASALFFANVYPTARIYCYEPSQSNFAYLQTNTAAFADIEAFNVGLADVARETRLFIGQNHYLQHSLIPNPEVSDRFEMVSVQRASVALAGKLAGRCVLKLDTEGCEVPILQDLQPLLSAADVLYVEYHSERDRRQIDSLLADHFTLFFSRTFNPHRGNLGYLSARILSENPAFGQLELRPPTG